MSEIVKILTDQRKNEEKTFLNLKPIYEKTENAYLDTLLEIIVQDSKKHKKICEAVIVLKEQNQLVIPEPILEETTINIFQNQIEQEKNTITELESIQDKLDPKSRALISYMMEEKKRNHQILTELMELLHAQETDMSQYYQIADNLMKKSHQPAKPARTQY